MVELYTNFLSSHYPLSRGKINPTHARLEEGRFIPILLCSYLPLALVGWVGLRGGWHLIRSVYSVPQEGYSPR
jgi:hypothetical protein